MAGGTANNVQAWSSTAASNNTADSTITSSDNQSPDTLDNDVRNIMASVRNLAKDIGGALVAGGTATALTITTNQQILVGHIANGYTLFIRTASAATGAATIAIDALSAVNIKRADGAAIAAGDWISGQVLVLVYSSTATAFLAANIGALAINGLTADATPDPAADYVATYDASAAGHKKVLLSKLSGMLLLTSGTVAAATLDIVLTSYTAYRGIKIFLSGLIPATDGVTLLMRFSTDGGSTYDAAGYNYVTNAWDDTGFNNLSVSGSATSIFITTASVIGNGATEGYNGEFTLMAQTSTALWARVFHSGYYISASATPAGNYVTGGGARETAQDTDAVRFLFSSGNIASGSYAVYGLV